MRDEGSYRCPRAGAGQHDVMRRKGWRPTRWGVEEVALPQLSGLGFVSSTQGGASSGIARRRRWRRRRRRGFL
jgi:hypothetical protein